ncbi:hypothetical protein G7046_g279 [Stylonectria norvegica]|nr:hypothetical protein G7046_g279 [Stylonectria norvegica]
MIPGYSLAAPRPQRPSYCNPPTRSLPNWLWGWPDRELPARRQGARALTDMEAGEETLELVHSTSAAGHSPMLGHEVLETHAPSSRVRAGGPETPETLADARGGSRAAQWMRGRRTVMSSKDSVCFWARSRGLLGPSQRRALLVLVFMDLLHLSSALHPVLSADWHTQPGRTRRSAPEWEAQTDSGAKESALKATRGVQPQIQEQAPVDSSKGAPPNSHRLAYQGLLDAALWLVLLLTASPNPTARLDSLPSPKHQNTTAPYASKNREIATTLPGFPPFPLSLAQRDNSRSLTDSSSRPPLLRLRTSDGCTTAASRACGISGWASALPLRLTWQRPGGSVSQALGIQLDVLLALSASLGSLIRGRQVTRLGQTQPSVRQQFMLFILGAVASRSQLSFLDGHNSLKRLRPLSYTVRAENGYKRADTGRKRDIETCTSPLCRNLRDGSGRGRPVAPAASPRIGRKPPLVLDEGYEVSRRGVFPQPSGHAATAPLTGKCSSRARTHSQVSVTEEKSLIDECMNHKLSRPLRFKRISAQRSPSRPYLTIRRVQDALLATVPTAVCKQLYILPPSARGIETDLVGRPRGNGPAFRLDSLACRLPSKGADTTDKRLGEAACLVLNLRRPSCSSSSNLIVIAIGIITIAINIITIANPRRNITQTSTPAVTAIAIKVHRQSAQQQLGQMAGQDRSWFSGDLGKYSVKAGKAPQGGRPPSRDQGHNGFGSGSGSGSGSRSGTGSSPETVGHPQRDAQPEANAGNDGHHNYQYDPAAQYDPDASFDPAPPLDPAIERWADGPKNPTVADGLLRCLEPRIFVGPPDGRITNLGLWHHVYQPGASYGYGIGNSQRRLEVPQPMKRRREEGDELLPQSRRRRDEGPR